MEATAIEYAVRRTSVDRERPGSGSSDEASPKKQRGEPERDEDPLDIGATPSFADVMSGDF